MHFTFLHGKFFWQAAVEAQKDVLHSVAIVSRISCFGWLLKQASTIDPPHITDPAIVLNFKH